MLAARSSEVAARTSGISPAKSKIMIFALSAGIAGFGGALLGIVNGAISPFERAAARSASSGSRSR